MNYKKRLLSLLFTAILLVGIFSFQNCGNSFSTQTKSDLNTSSAIKLCGSANGSTSQTPPVSNLCSQSTASLVTGAGPFTWTCSDSSSGAISSCSSSLVGPYTTVASGSYHSCALKRGEVWCWGDNAVGELGDGTTTSSATAVKVKDLPSQANSITVGIETSCALIKGEVWCWGLGFHGALGNGSTDDSSVPVKVLGLTNVSSIASGNFNFCALSGGSVFCWGYSSDGSLEGVPDAMKGEQQISSPVQVEGLKNIVSLGVGRTHFCGVSKDGDAYCWGSNVRGELGLGDQDQASSLPHAPQIVSKLGSYTLSVGSGFAYSCAIANDGSVSCWGSGEDGTIGNSSFQDTPTPAAVVGIPGRAQKLAVGNDSACALVESEIYCWGTISNGWSVPSLLLAKTNSAYKISGLPGPAVDVSTQNGNSVCASLADGSVYCWGVNYHGQLGNNSQVDSLVPVRVQFLQVIKIPRPQLTF